MQFQALASLLTLVLGCTLSCGASLQCNWNGAISSNGVCSCFHGFQGKVCEVDCGCEGHGTCQNDGTCVCEAGWKWSTSEKKCVFSCQCPDGKDCIAPDECGCSVQCVQGTCKQGLCICHEGYTGMDCSKLDVTTMTSKDVAVGMNLGGISYYSSEVKFVDAFKQSMPWITQRDGVSTWNTHEIHKVSMRSDGYPARLEDGLHLVTLMYRNFGIHMISGDYTVLHDGEGEIRFKLLSNHIKYNGKGRIVVNFPRIGTAGIALILQKTNPLNPIHNIRVLPPGFEYTYDRFPFHPLYLENLRLFSEFRYMDFGHTNTHLPEPTTWEGRTTPNFQTQGSTKGGSIEYMIQLANIMGSNPWFCVPHAADDDYVTKFAEMVKAKLRPDLKIYLEYSNEVWNGIFGQSDYAKKQGAQHFHIKADDVSLMKFYTLRSTQIANLWIKVFGSQSGRLIPVWAWQTAYYNYNRQALEMVNITDTPIKALAITSYFSCGNIARNNATEMPHMSMAEIEGFCDRDLINVRNTFLHYSQVAKAKNLKLLMYEGGPAVLDTSHRNLEITDKAIAFNRDPAIEGPTYDVLETWRGIVVENTGNPWPGGLFNYFSFTGTPSKYGSWGMLEYTGQLPETVPKYRAVAKFIRNHYGKNPVGPGCSFVQNTSEVFGCYKPFTFSHYECGHSVDFGNTWNKLFDTTNVTNEVLVLDGADLKGGEFYIRAIDVNLVTSEHFKYNVAKKMLMKVSNNAYYSGLMHSLIMPRLPNGVFHGLDRNIDCGGSTGDGIIG